jgi:hypothetical protein
VWGSSTGRRSISQHLARLGSSNGFSACTLDSTSKVVASVSLSDKLQVACRTCWKSDRLSPEQARIWAIRSQANQRGDTTRQQWPRQRHMQVTSCAHGGFVQSVLRHLRVFSKHGRCGHACGVGWRCRGQSPWWLPEAKRERGCKWPKRHERVVCHIIHALNESTLTLWLQGKSQAQKFRVMRMTDGSSGI